MAQTVTTHLVDDLTGDTIEEGRGRTVSFSFDGGHYEIDLTDDNADALREAFSDYVAVARKVSGRAGPNSSGSAPKRGNAEELAKIREWANANGHEVSSRGRISQTVRDAYDAAHWRPRAQNGRPTRGMAGRSRPWPISRSYVISPATSVARTKRGGPDN